MDALSIFPLLRVPLGNPRCNFLEGEIGARAMGGGCRDFNSDYRLGGEDRCFDYSIGVGDL